MAKRPKIDRKTLKQPDEFVTQGTSVLDQMAQHQGLILKGIIAVLVVWGGVWAYNKYSENKLNDAWMAYNKLSDLEGDARLKALEDYHNNFTHTRPGYLAAVALADHYFETERKAVLDGKAAEGKSEQWYGKALEFSGLEALERQLVLVDQGKAYELSQKWDPALAAYQKASEINGEAKGLAALNIGRAFQAKGQTDEAAQQYDKVATEFETTEYAQWAKIYRRALGSKLLPSKSE